LPWFEQYAVCVLKHHMLLHKCVQFLTSVKVIKHCVTYSVTSYKKKTTRVADIPAAA
jgi:hypothetical protein